MCEENLPNTGAGRLLTHKRRPKKLFVIELVGLFCKTGKLISCGASQQQD
jgi:hypothetical protein